MRRFTLPVSFGLSVFLLAAGELPAARGQAAKDKQKYERVHFETIDQVELHGNYWPGSNRRKSPCVLLLHKLGSKGSHEEGWDLLGDELAKKGFAVLSFDFRGHGDSSNVGAEFWKYRFNRELVKYKTSGGKMPDTINLSDFKPGYWPYLVNDITAARSYLERRNDSGDCNISNLILVGAEDGATLGVLWMATEARRYRLLPNPQFPTQPKLNTKAEGKDVVACVWLNLSSTIGPERTRTNVSAVLPIWLQDAGKTQKVPMAFFFGKEDTAAADAAKRWVSLVKTRGETKKETFARPIAGAGKVRGSPLLKVKEDEGTIAHLLADTYLGTTISERYGNNEWEKRESEKSAYVWAFGRGGPRERIQAKNFEEKNFLPIPLSAFGVR